MAARLTAVVLLLALSAATAQDMSNSGARILRRPAAGRTAGVYFCLEGRSGTTKQDGQRAEDCVLVAINESSVCIVHGRLLRVKHQHAA